MSERRKQVERPELRLVQGLSALLLVHHFGLWGWIAVRRGIPLLEGLQHWDSELYSNIVTRGYSWTAWGWFFFLFSPASFTLHSHHTEGLFLLLSLGAFASAWDGRFWRTAVFAGLCVWSRNQGVFVAITSARRIGGREAMLRVRAGEEGPRRAAAGASKAARRAGYTGRYNLLGHTPALAALASAPRLLGCSPGRGPLQRLRGQSQVLQYRAHPGGGRHVRQDPPPASTPHAGEHVDVERPLQQLCPIHSRRPLLPGRCLKPRAHLLRTCLRERRRFRLARGASGKQVRHGALPPRAVSHRPRTRPARWLRVHPFVV
nr:hypothetical protein [Vitiosangium sp. GDMCC 1.1324]